MKPTFFCLLLVISLVSFSQRTKYNKKDSRFVNKIEHVRYSLTCGDDKVQSKQLAFKNVIVKDVRYDTTYLSIFWYVDILKILHNQKLNLTNGLQADLAAYLNECFSAGFSKNNAQLICYIKRFSLSGKDTIFENIRLHESNLQVNFEAECYYSVGDLLFPAVRLDTNYGIKAGAFKKEFVGLIKKIVKPLNHKLASIDSLTVVRKKSYSIEEIENRYRERLNLPIFTDTYVRGVYRDIGELKNNSPSIRNFTVKQSALNAFYLLDSVQNVITPSGIFGFCDGKELWVQSGDFSYPLIKVGNSFEYFISIPYNAISSQTIKLLVAVDLAEDSD